MSTTATHHARRGTIAGAVTGFLIAAIAVGTTAVWSSQSGDTTPGRTPTPAPAAVDTHVIKRPCFNAPAGGMVEEGGVPMCTVVVPK